MAISDQYFRAVYADFQAKVATMAELVREHPGEVGRLREVVLTQLLREYLPSRYELGTGFVVDSFGNRSRQSDIVIYDRTDSLNLFERTGPILFPVESVYATIEVKTTLTAPSADDACAQIASVKQCKATQGTVGWETSDDGGLAIVQRPPQSPIGIVFFFQSASNTIDTIAQQLTRSIESIEAPHQPDAIVVVKEAAVVRYSDLAHTSESFQRLLFPVILRDAQGNLLKDAQDNWQLVAPANGTSPGTEVHLGEVGDYSYDADYKVCDSKTHGLVLADSPRILLTFLGSLDRLLKLRPVVGPRIDDYLGTHFGEGFLI